MICIEEIESTLKRLEIIKNNVDDCVEKYTCDVLMQNLNGLIKQLSQMSTTPEYRKMAEQQYSEEKPCEH